MLHNSEILEPQKCLWNDNYSIAKFNTDLSNRFQVSYQKLYWSKKMYDNSFICINIKENKLYCIKKNSFKLIIIKGVGLCLMDRLKLNIWLLIRSLDRLWNKKVCPWVTVYMGSQNCSSFILLCSVWQICFIFVVRRTWTVHPGYKNTDCFMKNILFDY